MALFECCSIRLGSNIQTGGSLLVAQLLELGQWKHFGEMRGEIVGLSLRWRESAAIDGVQVVFVVDWTDMIALGVVDARLIGDVVGEARTLPLLESLLFIRAEGVRRRRISRYYFSKPYLLDLLTLLIIQDSPVLLNSLGWRGCFLSR
ncbi:hypothetical protein [uncultured Pseudomonas sp.]|uniref:hypothetical protein n=1 Tax=uncultured Pseudomonas sp. TaxID=114707 RepID=UPI0025DF99D0|nr:hypothetical protein [uncultured Pseudomonas sp.]